MSDAASFSVLGIAGSLRQGSFNRLTLQAAQAVAPEGMSIDIFDRLGEIPLYNEDIRGDGDPDAVEALAAAIRDADAVLIATPEYNYSISGVLKNAIDWLSRSKPQPFKDKPLAIMGAAMGALGTARAQYHLRQIFVFLEANVLSRPEVFIGGAHTKFGEDGTLNDDIANDLIRQELEALMVWGRRLAS